ncbi:MAG: nitrate ABC transporter permease, partial [Clostridiales bacterium]
MRNKYLNNAFIIIFWLIVWQIAAMAVNQAILLPKPVMVGKTLLRFLGESEFWLAITHSLLKIMLGFFLAMILGSGLAFLGAKFSFVHQLIYPILSIIKATPVASFIILALIWINSASLSTFIAFLMVLPMFYANIYQGLKNVDVKLLEVAKVFGLNKRRTFREVYLPSLKPYLISTCTIGLGFAWKSGVAAEVIGLPAKTIGNQLYYAKVYLQTDEL